MKTTTKLKFAYALPLIAVMLPYVVFAAAQSSIHDNVWSINTLKGPLVTCWGAPVTYTNNTSGNGFTTSTNPNACHDVCDLVATTANVVYFGIGVVIWIIAPIMFAWSGISLMLSRGNPEAASGAKSRATRTVIGLLIVICAYIIVYTFVHVIGVATSIGGFGADACTILQ